MNIYILNVKRNFPVKQKNSRLQLQPGVLTKLGGFTG